MAHQVFHFEIRPTKEQEEQLWLHFKGVRFVYNHFLSERKEQYRLTQTSDKYHAQCKSLTQLKRQDDYRWLNKVNAQSLQQSLKQLEAAYNNFFEKRAAYPRYHSCQDNQSFRVPQSFKIQGSKLTIPKIKNIKIIHHRKIEGRICYIAVSYKTHGKYYVSICCEVEHKQYPITGRLVGVDLGIKDLAITSDNKRYKNHRYTKKYARKLKRYQQHLSRKQKGSKQRNKIKKQVAKIHAKIRNARHDTLHKITHELVKTYDIICIETPDIQYMAKNRKLTKHFMDAAWGTLRQFLRYKADRHGRTVIAVSQFFPSSKTCCHCRFVNEKLTLADREWTCPKCGQTLDRDFNAACNILAEGLNSVSAGVVEYTPGVDIRPTRRRTAMKGAKF